MLTRYENNGIELVIDNETGEAFATINGYARMSGKNKSTISRRAEVVAPGVIKMAEMDTGYGLKLVALIPANLVFDWMWDDNPELARTMGKAGATIFLYQVAGYKVKAEEAKQEQAQLPPADVRLANLAQAMQFFDLDTQNPRFKQGIQDLVGDILGLTQNAIPESTEVWLGVAERAEQLGYKPTFVVKHRNQLGKYVKTCAKKNKLERRTEQRLCNGTQRDISIYLQCDRLDATIKEFLDAKLASE